MIIDYQQKKYAFDLSYVDKKGFIQLESVNMPDGYYKYAECSENDHNKIPNFESFNGRHIKKEKHYKFDGMNINEFFEYDLKNTCDDFSKFYELNYPMPFSVDIETDITDEFGYSNATDVENRILSISVTNAGMKSILFQLKNENLDREINVLDKAYIDNILKDATGHFFDEYDLSNYEIKTFDSEYDMLEAYFQCVNKYFHFTFGWNFIDYDMRYIGNRAEKIGLSLKMCSPSNSVYDKSYGEGESKIVVKLPKHRMIACYMMLFKASYTYRNIGNYSLNNAADIVLGLKKVSYKGNLRLLYREDPLKFIAYSLVDTILVMLIHKKTNLIGVDLFQSYYTNIPYSKITQNAVSEALVYKQLRKENKFLLESEYTKLQGTYPGGFVKNPIKKLVESLMGLDFRALYPMSMITLGLSPGAKIDFVYVDADGKPKTNADMEKWLKYKAMGYCLAPTGRIYDVNEIHLYTRILLDLAGERETYEKIASDIYINIIPKIEREIENRQKLLNNG